MVARSDQLNLSNAVLQAAQCAFNYVCLSDQGKCRTENFLDRDLELIRCLTGENCQHVQYYNGMTICSCPVKRALL